MSWDDEFDFPVPGCRTYKQAADLIMKLPAKTQKEPHWQFAGEMLIEAAEQGGGWTMFACMAMNRALDHGKPEVVKEPRRKVAKKYRIVR